MTTAAPPASPQHPLRAVLFDLDGTLVDPAGGITDGIASALAAQGLPVPPPAVLASLVGPALADGLVEVLGVEPDLVPAVVAHYRTWYRETGMGRAVPYPGVVSLLAALRAAGVRLAVATQKPEPLAHELLRRHGLAAAFDVICGAHADETLRPGDLGYRRQKPEIIAAALAALAVTPQHAIMVGDRRHDVHGAHANRLPCIGVTWGFAGPEELATAGALALVPDPAALGVLLQTLSGSSAEQERTHGAV